MRVALISVLLLLAACERNDTPEGRGEHAELGPVLAAPGTGLGCDMRVEKPWAGAEGFRIIADAIGVTCPEASISIFIAGPREQSHMAVTFQARHVPTVFGGASALATIDRAGMQRALTHWLDESASRFNDSGDLPEWPRRQPDARDGARAFHPEMSRRAYEDLRAEKRPLFCFDADDNSIRCHVLLADGTVIRAAVARPVR